MSQEAIGLKNKTNSDQYTFQQTKIKCAVKCLMGDKNTYLSLIGNQAST